jgi:hypothetical protein
MLYALQTAYANLCPYPFVGLCERYAIGHFVFEVSTNMIYQFIQQMRISKSGPAYLFFEELDIRTA